MKLAQEIVDHWVEEYPTKEDAEDELGNLDDLLLQVIEQVQVQGLSSEDGIIHNASMVEQVLF